MGSGAMNALRAICEEAVKIRRQRAGLDDKVADRIASGGRKPSYAPSLSYESRPMTGLFATLSESQKAAALAYDGPENSGDWIEWAAPDRPMARALTEAGYMPLPEYIAMYGLIEDGGA
jgi:hypothetical protein